jgi:glycine hydroxymethyltransferase
LKPEDWGVNVQPYSGSPANFAAYTAVLKPGDKLMGLDLYCGGHLTHGFQTETKKISATSLYFQSKSYKIDEKDGVINYSQLEKDVLDYKPNLIICGASAYPRDFDYKEYRRIADKVGALVMADIAHISGLIATKEHNNPFEYCDLVTTTTHKSLRGPRAGMIFFNKKRDPSLEEKVNFAVFPMIQGGPHNHQIAGIATQLKEVASSEFKEYSKQIKRNAKALADSLMGKGYKLVSNGTDNHLMLWDVRPLQLTGSKIEKVCDMVHITLNKNTIVGDKRYCIIYSVQ